MSFSEVHSVHAFFSWIFSLPAHALTFVKEDGPDSPFSMRRLTLIVILLFARDALTIGFRLAYAAGAGGAPWQAMFIFMAPFFLCICFSWAIVANLTATDIKMIVDATKKGE
jgi:hypothetical protein